MLARNATFISLSFALTRSRRDFLRTRNLPSRDLPLMKVKPRKLKVSGLPRVYASDGTGTLASWELRDAEVLSAISTTSRFIGHLPIWQS